MRRYRVEPGTAVDLSSADPQDTGGLGKDAATKRIEELRERLSELQRVLWAEHRHRILIVLQAPDAGGKDGTIRHVFHGVNPQGVRVVSFKAPSSFELAHDYLWRIHRHVPGDGEIAIFNRSHYEDVLVVRVNELVPEQVWSRRYDQINDFERMLADEGTTLVKLFLHISRDEQKKRLQERLRKPHKRWKFNPEDLRARQRWDDYVEAYEAVLSRTTTEACPWYIVPADHKWFRNLVVSEILVDRLERLDMHYPEPKYDIDPDDIE